MNADVPELDLDGDAANEVLPSGTNLSRASRKARRRLQVGIAAGIVGLLAAVSLGGQWWDHRQSMLPRSPWPTAERANFTSDPATVLNVKTLPVGSPLSLTPPYGLRTLDASTLRVSTTLVTTEGSFPLEGVEMHSLWRTAFGVLASESTDHVDSLTLYDNQAKPTVLAKRSSFGGLPWTMQISPDRTHITLIADVDGSLATRLVDLRNPSTPTVLATHGALTTWLPDGTLLVMDVRDGTWHRHQNQGSDAATLGPVIALPTTLDQTASLQSVPGHQAMLAVAPHSDSTSSTARFSTCLYLLSADATREVSSSCIPAASVQVLSQDALVLVSSADGRVSLQDQPNFLGAFDLKHGTLRWLPNLVGASTMFVQDDTVVMADVGTVAGGEAIAVRCFVKTATCERAPDPKHLLTAPNIAVVTPW